MDAIITIDEAQRIVIFNAAAEKMFGCTQAEATGQSLEQFIPQRFRQEHAEHIRRFGHTGLCNRDMGTLCPFWGLRSNGEEFPVEASISQAESGSKKLFTVILRDATERKQADQVRERLAAIVDSSDDAIISKDLHGIINAWNHGAEKLFGYTSAEAIGKPMLMLFPSERVNEEDDLLARISHGESIEHFETVRVRKDGKHIDVSATISPIRDTNGAIIGASKIARDVTERNRAAAALADQAEELSRQAEELARSRQALETQTLTLQSVLDSISEGLVAADQTGKFILWNPAATRIVGLGAANVPPEQWTDHYGTYLPDTITPFPSEQNPLLRAIRGEACSAEMYIRNDELETGVWVEISGNPLKSKDGVARGGVVAFRDVTQRRADEREIRTLNNELEARVVERTAALQAANHELEAFTYSVSHDLRAPLRHISGFSKILLEDFAPSLPAEAQHHLQRIVQGAARMGTLVDELLNLARVGRQSLAVQPTELSSIVQDVLVMLEPEIVGRNVEWKIAELPVLECDPTLVRQVFQNLLHNALKYSRPRSPAIIEIGQTEKYGLPVIFVKDNGVGFNMKYADKLFGVFQRLHRAEEFEGTGVGLATVQRIVHKHGGRVWAEAEIDRGATFYFTLGSSEHSESKTIAVAAASGGRT
jgi:PAS domain S-box-containing protein